jgi:dCMP deaminase
MHQVPNWNQWFSQMADHVKIKSKDRSTQVGAVIVGEGHHVLSVGYNGFPRGIDDDVPQRHERPLKYYMTSHAEENAILHAARHGTKVLGADLYCTTPFICAECAKAIIQAGIARTFAPDLRMEAKGDDWHRSCAIGRNMLLEAGVEVWLMDESGRQEQITGMSEVPGFGRIAPRTDTDIAQWDNLIDALETYGNLEGTESQLNRTADYLQTALARMTPGQRTVFYADPGIQQLLDKYAHVVHDEAVGCIVCPHRISKPSHQCVGCDYA